jgi:hypothetical protein
MRIEEWHTIERQAEELMEQSTVAILADALVAADYGARRKFDALRASLIWERGYDRYRDLFRQACAVLFRES